MSNIDDASNNFEDGWLSENPADSSIGGSSSRSNIDEDGLRLATNSPLYKGPASLKAGNSPPNDPYTITVDGYDDEEDPESPRDTENKGKRASGGEHPVDKKQRRRNILIGSICILIVVIICIIVGVVVSKNKDDNSTTQPATDPDPTGPNTNNTAPPSGNRSIVDTEDSYILPYQGNREGIVTYTSSAGPFHVEIPTLASDMSSTGAVYGDESEFRDGLSRSALFLINNVAGRLLGWPGYANAGYGNGGVFWGVDEPVPESDLNEEIAADVPTSSMENVDSFQTNNQEMNLDEADVSKSDGTYIYAAYGNSLLIFSANSKDVVLKLQMPPAQCGNLTEAPLEPEVDGNTTNTGTATPGNVTEPGLGTAEVVEGEDIVSIPEPGHSCPQVFIQSILLDTNHSTLALVVSGYGKELREKTGTETPVLMDFLSTQVRLYSTKPLINNGAGISLLAVQNLSGYYKQGYVMEESGIAHLVTSSGVNTQDWLVAPIEALKNQKAVRNATSDEEAFLKSVRMARSEIVDAFVNQTVNELSATTGGLPRIAPLRLPVVNESGIDGFENLLLGSGYGNEFVQITSFDMRGDRTLAENSTEGDIPVSETVQFVANSWGEVYAAETMLINTGVAYSFNGQVEEDMTVIYAFAVDDMTTTPFATGKVPGLLLNRYALDYHDGLFRVATTTSTWAADDFFVDVVTSDEVGIRNLQENSPDTIFLEDCPSVADVAGEDCFTNGTVSMCANMTARGCSSIVYSNQTCPFQLVCLDDLQSSQCPPLVSDGDNPCLNETNLAECIALEADGCEKIQVAESCPLQFFCSEEPNEEEPEIPVTSSTTQNRIFVLERPSEAMPEMAIVGNVTMGKPNESFTAVRFFDTIAYAVTFLRTDPFYVVSFEEPQTPVVLGELEISGFSSYMHSIDANNTKILTVGTETTPEGQEIGLKISLFDATNRTSPTEVAKFVFSEGNSWSTANWDFRAFRYVKLTEEEGRIIIPVSLFDGSDAGESFDGFVVFSLSPEGISESFRISHQATDDIFLRQLRESASCNLCGYLQERSFVIQGNVTTLKGQTARSHNLETGELLWSRDFVGVDYCCSS